MSTTSKTKSFSIIVPIYNTEAFLREAIDSVINQTIGFKEHIKLILINDGSTDGSEAICLQYKEQYPDNIVYIYKENGGVSSARNLGMKYVDTPYVNFFDSDDIWSPEAFAAFYRFLKKHDKEVDMVSSKVRVFGDLETEHVLNYKYEEDAVIDLNEKPNYVQAAIGNCVFVADALKDMQFDTSMKTSEDTLFLNTVLLKRCKCGVVKEGEYQYRRHAGGATVLKSRYDRFVVEPTAYNKKMLDLSIERYGKVLPFISYLMMYDIQWRLTEQPTPDITKEQIEQYQATIQDLLQGIDDGFIYDQQGIQLPVKCAAFRLKYGDDFYKNMVQWEEGRAYYNGTVVCNLRSRRRCRFFVTERLGDTLIMKGVEDFSMLNMGYDFYAVNGQGERIYPSTAPYPKTNVVAFNTKTMARGQYFCFRLPLKAGEQYSFFVDLENGPSIRLRPSFFNYAKLYHGRADSYWCTGKFIIKLISNSIRIYNYSKKTHIISEIRSLKGVLASTQPNVTKKALRKMALYRIAYHFASLFKKRSIWLMYDRDYHATDNGAAMFKYSSEHVDKSKINLYFALSKDSDNYAELKQYGKVIEPYSFKHKMVFLLANKWIASSGDFFVRDSFPGKMNSLSDFLDAEFVYLQHGVMQGDLSNWLNVLDRNIKLLVAGTQMEVDNILKCNFGYSDDVVKLLGVPRYDALSSYDRKKKIAFLPTWRHFLVGRSMQHGSEREKIPNFKNTDYCVFYNGLINNKRLLETMQQYGYEGDFFLHPVYRHQHDDFKGNDTIKVHAETASYQKIMGEAAMMVTDYSGVQFDFAYQRRPLVYSQFDNIYSGGNQHIYKEGFFDYSTMGFGPIATTVDEVVDYLIGRIKEDCVMEEKYKQRVDSFYKYNDTNNCARVFDAICEMK